MSDEAALFRDFAIIVLAAGSFALLFYYLRQPVVLGYLAAGFIVGSHSPGPSFVTDPEVMGFLGNIGIVFLLFALGLEFSLKKLRKVGATAILAGTIEIAFMLALGYGVGRAFGWTPLQSAFLGAVMSVSSTTIIVKVLAELGHKDEEWAQTALGILIIEDVLAVLILTALSSAAATGNFEAALLTSLVSKLAIFLGAALLLGVLFAPRIVDRLAVLRVEEVMVILATGIGFGMALLASYLGFSPGLGAFVAGALMAESPRVAKVTHKIEPARDIFTAIFFVTVGAAFDPAALLTGWRPILAVVVAVIAGKVMGVTLAAFATGTSPANSVRIGLTLAQIGEFAFIIAALGVSVGAAPPSLYAIAITVSATSVFLTPYLIRAAPRVVGALGRHLPSGLQAFARTYGGWVKRVGHSDQDPLRDEIRTNVLTASLLAAVVIAIFGLGNVFSRQIREALTGQFGQVVASLGLEWLLISVAAAPFVLILAREIRQIVNGLARAATPARLRGHAPTDTERLLRRTFGFIATVVTALIVVLIGGLFIDNILYVAIVAAVGITIGSIVLGAGLTRFHREVESTIDRMVRGEGHPEEARQEAIRILGDSSAWGAASSEVLLPEVSGAGHRTIGQLRLRELTGVSVVSVQREGGAPLVNPGPALRFEPGDRILLVGDDAALLRASEILLGKELGIDGGASEITLSTPRPGATLADLQLDEGVTVLLVRRDGRALEAQPALSLRTGDVLVVSGTSDAIDRARRAIAS